MMTAGPIRPRIMHRRQLQRTRSLIESHPFSQPHCSRAAQPVAKHQYADANQDQRPEAPYSPEWEPIEIVQKKKHAQPNQNDRANGTVRTPRLKRIDGSFAEILSPGSLHGVDSHIQNEASKQKGEQVGGAVSGIAIEPDDHRDKHDDMNERLVVFPVVHSAETGDKSEEEGKARAAARARARRGKRKRPRRGSWCSGHRRGAGNSHDASKAVFAIKNITHRAHTRRTHSLAAIAAVADS